MNVRCRHCGGNVRPARKRQHGAAHWAVLLAFLAAGVFLHPAWIVGAIIPLAVPSRWHACPRCGLKLD